MKICNYCKEGFDENLHACPHCGHPSNQQYAKSKVKGFFYFSPYLCNFLEKTLTLALSIGVFFIPMISTSSSLPLWDTSFSNLTSFFNIITIQIQKIMASTVDWDDPEFLSMVIGVWIYLGFALSEVIWFIPRWFISLFALLFGNSKKNRHRINEEMIASYYHVQHDFGSLSYDKTLIWVLIVNAAFLYTVCYEVPYIRCFDAFHSAQMLNMGTLCVLIIAGLDLLMFILRCISMAVLKGKIKKAYRLAVYKPLKNLYTY